MVIMLLVDVVHRPHIGVGLLMCSPPLEAYIAPSGTLRAGSQEEDFKLVSRTLFICSFCPMYRSCVLVYLDTFFFFVKKCTSFQFLFLR